MENEMKHRQISDLEVKLSRAHGDIEQKMLQLKEN